MFRMMGLARMYILIVFVMHAIIISRIERVFSIIIIVITLARGVIVIKSKNFILYELDLRILKH